MGARAKGALDPGKNKIFTLCFRRTNCHTEECMVTVHQSQFEF